VFVVCHYTGGMEARIECPGMPADTNAMAELVAAAAAQCLAQCASAGTWQVGTGTRKKTRTIKRDGGNGRPWSSGDRLYGGPGAGPSPRDVTMTMPDVIDVDGLAMTSTADHQRRHPPKLPPPPKALPPPPEKLDADKARRASAAMAALLKSTGNDDGA